MTNIDERVKSMAEKFQETEKLPYLTGWFNLSRKENVTSEHLLTIVKAFYNSPKVKEWYEINKGRIDSYEKGLFNHTMKFYNQGKDVSEIIRTFPPARKAEFIPYLLKEKEDHADDIVDYLLEL